MTITQRRRIELFVKQQLEELGDEFYTELARVLERIQSQDRDNGCHSDCQCLQPTGLR